MDTLTQVVLGGAVAYAAVGKNAPRKALLWGAAFATLPDLDVLVPYDNDLDSMTFHRSWSHSWIVHSMLAPVLAFILSRFDKSFSYLQWLAIIFLAFVTHAGLDALTVYGTQLFWPFKTAPVSGGSVFIIDPLYTVPLLLGFLAVLFAPRKTLSDKLMRYGFAFSCVYLLWGYGAQQWVETKAEASLAQQNMHYDHIQVSASPLNTVLWRIIAINHDHYYEGFYSIFDKTNNVTLNQYDRGGDLIDNLETFSDFQQFAWFNKGLYKLQKHDNLVVGSDLRMGMEPHYFFRFKLAEYIDGKLVETTPNQVPLMFDRKAGINWVWQRIWNPTVGPMLISAKELNTVPKRID